MNYPYIILVFSHSFMVKSSIADFVFGCCQFSLSASEATEEKLGDYIATRLWKKLGIEGPNLRHNRDLPTSSKGEFRHMLHGAGI